MASWFRREISRKVYAVSRILFPYENITQEEALSSLVRVGVLKMDEPHFYLSWNDFAKKEPSIAKEVSPEKFLLEMKTQGYLADDYIKDASVFGKHQDSLIFTFSTIKFIMKVLEDTLDPYDLPKTSCVLQHAPKKNIIVEYSSPNIAKPFHVGHLRSTIIGNFIANINEFLGHSVLRVNYLGDWGTQYGLLTAGFKQFGSAEDLNKDPLNHLLQVYVAANKKCKEDPDFFEKARLCFQQLEEGNHEMLDQWKKLRDLSIKEYSELYKRIGVYFDKYHGESMYHRRGKDIIKQLLDSNLAYRTQDGAVEMVIPMQEGREETVVLGKKDGSTLYLTRDIAAAVERKTKYNFDTAYYVVDNDQSDHFTALKSILKLMGYDWYSSIHHVKFGRIKNLSTRMGNLVFLKDLLDEAQSRALKTMIAASTTKVTEDMETFADILGTSSVLINDMCSHRQNEYNFDWDRVLHNKGDSGISLQYTHARLSSLEKYCGISLNVKCDIFSLTYEPLAIHLLQHLVRFDEIILQASEKLEPCILVQYLFTLSHLVGRANKVLKVKGQENHIAKARLLLFHVSKNVLKTGLEILGIHPLEEM